MESRIYLISEGNDVAMFQPVYHFNSVDKVSCLRSHFLSVHSETVKSTSLLCSEGV